MLQRSFYFFVLHSAAAKNTHAVVPPITPITPKAAATAPLSLTALRLKEKRIVQTGQPNPICTEALHIVSSYK